MVTCRQCGVKPAIMQVDWYGMTPICGSCKEYFPDDSPFYDMEGKEIHFLPPNIKFGGSRKFKEWFLKEVGTSTGCIATFARISIPLVRRVWPFEAEDEDEEDDDDKKKKKKRKKKKDD